jgi:hypothetical protein
MRIFAMLLIGATAAAASASQSASPKQTEQPSSKQLLSLSISVPDQIVTIGSEIKVKTNLTNISDHVLNFVDTNTDCDYWAEMRHHSGDPVPATDYKRQLGCNSRLSDGRRILVTLKPRESTEDEIELMRLYVLNRSGRYSVLVQRKLPKELGGGTVQSNTITIDVREKNVSGG